jgi:hypothetical protein
MYKTSGLRLDARDVIDQLLDHDCGALMDVLWRYREGVISRESFTYEIDVLCENAEHELRDNAKEGA